MKNVKYFLILLCFCLPGCVSKGIYWKNIASFEIKKYSEGLFPDPSVLVPVSARVMEPAHSILYVNKQDKIFIRVRHQQQGFNRERCLDNNQWSFCDFPNDDYKKDISYQYSQPDIENQLSQEEIATTLYQNLLQSASIEKITSSLDSAPEWEPEIYPDSFTYNNILWKNLSDEDKKLKILQTLKEMSSNISQRSAYRWFIDKNIYYGLIEYDSPDEHPVSPETQSFIKGLEETDAPPQFFYKTNLGDKTVILFHTFTSDFRIRASLMYLHWSPCLFFCFKGKVFIVAEQGVWVLSPDSKKYRHYPLPIVDKGSSPRPAFFQRDKWLYVFGKIKGEERKAYIFKTNLKNFVLE